MTDDRCGRAIQPRDLTIKQEMPVETGKHAEITAVVEFTLGCLYEMVQYLLYHFLRKREKENVIVRDYHESAVCLADSKIPQNHDPMKYG